MLAGKGSKGAGGLGEVQEAPLITPFHLWSLPQGPVDRYPFSVIPWAFWGVATDRCKQEGGSERVVVVNCTLVPTLESMQYSSYWWVVAVGAVGVVAERLGWLVGMRVVWRGWVLS